MDTGLRIYRRDGQCITVGGEFAARLLDQGWFADLDFDRETKCVIQFTFKPKTAKHFDAFPKGILFRWEGGPVHYAVYCNPTERANITEVVALVAKALGCVIADDTKQLKGIDPDIIVPKEKQETITESIDEDLKSLGGRVKKLEESVENNTE